MPEAKRGRRLIVTGWRDKPDVAYSHITMCRKLYRQASSAVAIEAFTNAAHQQTYITWLGIQCMRLPYSRRGDT